METVQEMSLEQLKEKIENSLQKLQIQTWYFGKGNFGDFLLFEKPRETADGPLSEEMEDIYNHQVDLLAKDLIEQGLEPYFQVNDMYSQPGIFLAPWGFDQETVEMNRKLTVRRSQSIISEKESKKNRQKMLEEWNAKFKEINTWEQFESFQQAIYKECLTIRSKRGGLETGGFQLSNVGEKEKVHYHYLEWNRTGSSYVENLYRHLKVTYY